MKSPFVLQLLAEARPGHCCLCDALLPRPKFGVRRRTKFCGTDECNALYRKLYDIDRGPRATWARTRA